MSIGAGDWSRLTGAARAMGFADVAVAIAADLPELSEARLTETRSACKGAGVYYPDRLRGVQLEMFPWVRGVVSAAWPLRPVPAGGWSGGRSDGWTGGWTGEGFLAAAFHPSGELYGPFKLAMAELKELVEEVTGGEARVFVDSPDICDRSAAVAAGLGWWGKSGNVLTRGHGSYVLLGTMLLSTAPDRGLVRHTQESLCGHCVECIRACPAGALADAFQCDVGRCLSLATQSPLEMDESTLAAVEARIYGCDVCQEVCPVNRRIFGSIFDLEAAAGEGSAGSAISSHDLLGIIESSDEAILHRFPELYLPGRQGWILRRNALIALVNGFVRGAGDGIPGCGTLSSGPPADGLKESALDALRRLAEEEGPVASYARWGLRVLPA